jgi:hypothetical protein
MPAGLNNLNPNFMFYTPQLKFYGSEFKPVVGPDVLGLASPGENTF